VSIYDFKALTTEQQADLAWDKGVFLMHRIEKETKFVLYQLEGIYIEFEYDAAVNKLVNLKSFINPDLLDPYFAQ